MFAGTIAQDVNSTEANIMAAVQKPFSTSLEAASDMVASLRERPSYPSCSRTCVRKTDESYYYLASSGHLSPVIHPDQIAQLILNATKGIKK
jgi:hypothetical protein